MKNMYEYVNYIEVDKTVDDLEKDFISDFSESEQKKIGMIFRPTKKQLKEIRKQLGFKKHH